VQRPIFQDILRNFELRIAHPAFGMVE